MKNAQRSRSRLFEPRLPLSQSRFDRAIVGEQAENLQLRRANHELNLCLPSGHCSAPHAHTMPLSGSKINVRPKPPPAARVGQKKRPTGGHRWRRYLDRAAPGRCTASRRRESLCPRGRSTKCARPASRPGRAAFAFLVAAFAAFTQAPGPLQRRRRPQGLRGTRLIFNSCLPPGLLQLSLPLGPSLPLGERIRTRK